MIYVTLLVIEKFFNSSRPNDSLSVRYVPIYNEFINKYYLQGESSHDFVPKHKVEVLSPVEKWRRAFRKVKMINRLTGRKKMTLDYKNSPYYIKYFFMISFWVIVNILVFVIQPVMADSNRNIRLSKDWSSFICNPSSPTCYAYSNLSVSKLFYFLNILYIFCCIQ